MSLRIGMYFIALFAAMTFFGCSDSSTDTPPDGGGNSIVFDRYGSPSNATGTRIIQNKRGDLFLATGGGLMKYSTSTKEWSLVASGEMYGDVQDIAVMPNGNIVCACRSRLLFVSSDEGDTWKLVLNNSTLQRVRFVIGNVFESWFTITQDDGKMIVWRSEDNGNSWVQRNTPNLKPESNIVLGFNSVDHVYFATGDTLYLSLDSGRSYRGMSEVKDIQQLHITSSGTIYMFTKTGGKMSTDSGRSPVDVQVPANVTEISKTNDGTLYATTRISPEPHSPGGKLFISTDNSATWSEIHSFSRATTSSTRVGTSVYVATDGTGVFTWTEATLWASIGPGSSLVNGMTFDQNGKLLVAGYGIFETSNGSSWRDLGVPGANIKAIAATSTGLIIYAAGSTLNISSNNGSNWITIPVLATLNALSFDSKERAYIGTQSGVFVSPDQGTTVNAITSTLSYDVQAVAVANDTTVYVSAIVGGAPSVYRSNTSVGYSFTEINNNIEGVKITSLAVTSKGHLYASDGVGVYISIDQGGSWDKRSIEGVAQGDNINAMLFDKNDFLYLGTNSAVVKSREAR